MPRKKPPETYALTLRLTKELHDKVHRLADAEDRSASAMVRRWIAEASEVRDVESA